jgi:hypothetical protein
MRHADLLARDRGGPVVGVGLLGAIGLDELLQEVGLDPSRELKRLFLRPQLTREVAANAAINAWRTSIRLGTGSSKQAPSSSIEVARIKSGERMANCYHVLDRGRFKIFEWPLARAFPRSNPGCPASCQTRRRVAIVSITVSAANNPFARRLERLYEQWEPFAVDQHARVLRWLLRNDEIRMFDAFVATEQHERGGTLPVLFIDTRLPFDRDWGFQVERELVEAQATSIDSGELERARAWKPEPASDDREAVIGALVGLHAALEGLAEQVVLVARPHPISDVELWNAWLADFARRAPSVVRCVVIDTAQAPQLEPLAQHGAATVMSVVAELDIAGATAELAGGRDPAEPDNRFRQLFVALGEAAGAGRVDEAKQVGAQALQLARGHAWPQLELAVHTLLGSTLISAGTGVDAISEFVAADAAAARCHGIDGLDATRLRLTAQLGLGAALVSIQGHVEAAKVYDGAAGLARGLVEQPKPPPDAAIQLLECCRMAAYCHERSGAIEQAWIAGLAALDAGETIAADQRPHSTLAWAGDALIELGRRHAAYEPQVPKLETRMATAFGRVDWRAQMSGGGR